MAFSPQKYLAQQIVLSVFLFIVLLLIIEGLLRIKTAVQRIDDIPYIKRNGLVFMTPNMDTVVMGGSFQPVHVITNNEGFATPETTLVPATNTIRIAFMGNSFTKGFEVDYTKKFTSRVGQILTEQSGANKKYEVLNFGNGGYSFVEQLLIYEQYVKKYHPDYVFLDTYPPTDFFRNSVFEPKRDYLKITPVAKLTNDKLLATNTTTTTPENSFELARFSKRIISGVNERISKLTGNTNPTAKKILGWLTPLLTKWGIVNNGVEQKDGQYVDATFAYMDPASKEATETMNFSAELVTKLGQQVEQDGARFGFIIIPSYWQADPKYTEKLTLQNPELDPLRWNTLFTATVGTKFPILDLLPFIKHSISDKHTQMFIRDTGHFTPTGHELVGHEIATFVRQIFALP